MSQFIAQCIQDVTYWVYSELAVGTRTPGWYKLLFINRLASLRCHQVVAQGI